MMRKLALLIVLALTGCSESGYYRVNNTTNARCIKTYVVYQSDRLVDLATTDGTIITVICRNDGALNIGNSANLYAKFEPGKWYKVTTVGYQQDWSSLLPTVTSVEEIPPPKAEAPNAPSR